MTIKRKPTITHKMGQTFCCRADDIDDLIEKNSSFSSSVSSAGQPLFLNEDNFRCKLSTKTTFELTC